MTIKPIRSNKDLKKALTRIDAIIDAKYGTPEYDELEVLSTLVEVYEDKNHPIPHPDPVDAIKFRMDQMGLRQADIANLFGGKNRTSEVLTRKRPLNLRMIRNLHEKLHVPSDSLIGSTVPASSSLKPKRARAAVSKVRATSRDRIPV